MKKISKTALSLFLAISMTGSLFTPLNITGAETETYSIDFSSANPFSGSLFKTADDAPILSDGAASSNNNSVTIHLDKETHSFGTLSVEAEIKSTAKSGWDSTYFAFRTPVRPMFIGWRNDGIIFFVNGNRIGIREKWDAGRMVTLSEEFDFSNYRKIYFEDNRDTNVFTIYANNDSGVKTLVCTVSFNANNYIVKNASGVQTSTGTIESSQVLKEGGFQISTWYATMSIKNITATMPTSPATPQGIWSALPYTSQNNSSQGQYVYAVGGYNSIDHGNVADIWGSDKPTETLFVGDKAGDIVVKYLSGETKTIPLIIGYTMWYYNEWVNSKRPIINTPENENLFKETMQLSGAFEANKKCLLKIEIDEQPIESIKIVDNSEKFGEPVFEHAFITSEENMPKELYIDGNFISKIDDEFFSTHTIDSDNPYPASAQQKVEQLARMMYTFEDEYQAAQPYVYPSSDDESYSIDFSTPNPFVNSAFKMGEGSTTISDSALATDGNGAVTFGLGKSTLATGIFKVEALIKTTPKGGWDSAYFAFRTPLSLTPFYWDDGIIFFVNGNRIGIREKWDASRMVTLSEEFDFSSYRKIYFEDNRDTNTFKIYADNDLGEKTLVLTVKFDGNNYTSTKASNGQTVTGRIDSNSIVNTGIFQIGTWYSILNVKNLKTTMQKKETFKIQYSGTPFANIATGVLNENSLNLAERVDETGFMHTSAKNAPEYWYMGVGTYALDIGAYYDHCWSRDCARGILSLLSINEIDQAEKAMSRLQKLMMYFPENNLTINNKAIPGHYTMVMNEPFRYPDQGPNAFGYPSKYNEATFGSSYRNIGNLETDAQGLMMMVTYSVWKARGSSVDWLNKNWTYINEQAKWIKWCFDNPDVSFAHNNLLLGECEPAHSEYTLYCNVPCYLGMLMHVEMARAAGKNDLADEWQIYADKLKQGISQVVNANGWNTSQFGYYHDPVTTFYSDYLGFDASSLMPGDWSKNSKKVFFHDIATSNLSESKFGRSLGYDHSMMTQNALLLDETEQAEIFMNNLSRACYAPDSHFPYIVPESISVDTQRGLVRKQGDLGNLVQMAEVIKTLLIPAGISPFEDETLTVMPRLIKDWSVDVSDYNIKYSGTKVNLNTSYPINNAQTAHISLDNTDEVKNIKFRSGPFPKAYKTATVNVNGEVTKLNTFESGDSSWVWVEINNLQTDSYDIAVSADYDILLTADKAHLANGTINISANVYMPNIADKTVMVVAIYKGNSLVKAETKLIKTSETSFCVVKKSVNIDYQNIEEYKLKAFVFNDINALQPLAVPLTLSASPL